jgi:hypothetical protein
MGSARHCRIAFLGCRTVVGSKMPTSLLFATDLCRQHPPSSDGDSGWLNENGHRSDATPARCNREAALHLPPLLQRWPGCRKRRAYEESRRFSQRREKSPLSWHPPVTGQRQTNIPDRPAHLHCLLPATARKIAISGDWALA